MMTPDVGSDGVEDDGSEMTVWGVEYRHALKLAAAKKEADAYRTALVAASQRAHINGQPAPVLFWTGTIHKTNAA